MRRFLINGEVSSDDADDFQHLLTLAYRDKARPLCLCKDEGVPMYVAKIGDQLVIKRMPLTGADHDAACPSYEPPYELSGLGPLMGGAIKLDPAAGTAALKLDFSLSKRHSSGAGAVGSETADSVKNDSKKLSLRGLLHFLWHESGLTEWTAHFAGKRHWWQVYHHLQEAARTMSVRQQSLAERLFVPEPFRAEEKAAIEQRRAQALSPLFHASTGPKTLMLLVGEVKEFSSARNGQLVIIKHMPGFRLYLEEPAWRRLQRRFDTELTLWGSNETSHLIAIATIAGSPSGVVTINEIALMTVTEQWLPIENAYEERLLDRLTRMREKMVKGLRFELLRTQPLANVILPEHRPLARVLYIVPQGADESFEAALREMIDARPDMSAWIWRTGEAEMPPLTV
ncbi:DUF1173 domain-containing protein [Rhizobium sp. CNPSo 3464]|uniref:DUF1173 domain-containing protein n=1 Tax=Rhizobium sp. CNPSo 3464 TaxID=3021406 RepID=UPI00254DF035|nr:DUF1173 domain-containing protein [Rhizobium sp. CNPSo 3464]MDK4741357.1 DUF1173 domain-containing protein [Rhizobium sp. CNPSo 3464]